MIGGIILGLGGAIGQGQGQLRQSQGHGGGAQSLPHVQVQLALRHADLQALHVGGGVDGPVGGGDVAHAVIAFGQEDQAELLEAGEDLLTDLAVGHLISLLRAVKQEGQVQHLGFLIEGGKTGGAGKDQVDGAHAGGLDRFGVAAQLVGVVDIQGDGAVRGLVHQTGVLNDCLSGDGVLVAGGIDGQLNGLDAAGGGSAGGWSAGAGIGGAAAGRSAVVSAGSQGKGHGAGQHKGSKFFHYRILLIVVSEATYHRPPFRQTDDCMTSDYSILRLH